MGGLFSLMVIGADGPVTSGPAVQKGGGPRGGYPLPWKLIIQGLTADWDSTRRGSIGDGPVTLGVLLLAEILLEDNSGDPPTQLQAPSL